MKYLNDVMLLLFFRVKMNSFKDNFLNFDRREKSCFCVETIKNITGIKRNCYEFSLSGQNQNI